MDDLKLGSLFDGSGGFPLAGVLNGIEPVWASEIEPFPIRVTKARFPNMKHLGDVTKINGAEIEPVDIITFGSPCQDLSVAGKQLGIHDGQRSNLFFEAIRIIKEMREHDRATGRADDDIRPRFAVWENVPGAFSSNKGADFQAVLQAFCDIEGADITVPMPPKGKWNPAGCIVGDGFSVAWRVYDAQYWGVPQRRKRIYLIADFGSERAGETLFSECESVYGNPAKGREAGEGTAADAEGSAGRSNSAIGCDLYNGQLTGNKAATLGANSGASANHAGPSVCYPINTMVATRVGKDDMRTCFGVGQSGDPQFTISAAHEHAVCYSIEGHVIDRQTSQNGRGWAEGYAHTLNATDRHAVCFAPTANYCGGYEESDVSETLQTGYHFGSGGDGALVCCLNDQGGAVMNVSDKAMTLRAQEHGHQPVVCVQNTGRGWWNEGEVAETLRTPCGGDSTKANLVVYDARGNGGGMTVPTITGDHENRITDYTAVCVGNGQLHQTDLGNKAGTLNCMHDQQAIITQGKPPRKYIVRRLTPLECCRLQGFPDWWTDGVEGPDSAIYKMWGNGIALPCAVDVIGRIAKELRRGRK